jgi:hypothetical protein
MEKRVEGLKLEVHRVGRFLEHGTLGILKASRGSSVQLSTNPCSVHEFKNGQKLEKPVETKFGGSLKTSGWK